MRPIVLTCIALLAPLAALADGIRIPSPQVEFKYEVEVLTSSGHSRAAGTVRTALGNEVSIDVASLRLDVWFQDLSPEEYVVAIRVYTADGADWRRVDGESITFLGRYGEEIHVTPLVGDMAIDLRGSVSREMINVELDVDPLRLPGMPSFAMRAWFALGVLAIVLSILFVVLYRKRS